MKRGTQHPLDIGIRNDLKTPSVCGPDGSPRTTGAIDQLVSPSTHADAHRLTPRREAGVQLQRQVKGLVLREEKQQLYKHTQRHTPSGLRLHTDMGTCMSDLGRCLCRKPMRLRALAPRKCAISR